MEALPHSTLPTRRSVTVLPIQSDAFRAAALRSERFRVLGLLGFLAASMLIVIIRYLGAEAGAEQTGFMETGALVILLIGYEAVIFRLIDRRQSQEAEPPSWLWPLNLIVETSFPTILLLISVLGSTDNPFQILVSPAVFLYAIFIILSTLRLSPRLCQLTGLLSAGGYLAVALFTMSQYPAPESGAFSFAIFGTYAALIFLGGLVASAVAGQIRGHVEAAMTEAETRRQMDRVKQDLDVARTIQQGLLPDTMPEVAGFEIGAWNKPADETGGDYYDWQAVTDGRVAISLADVSGHGIGPALVTAACRAYVRAAFPSVSSIGDEMDKINSLLVEDLPSDKFITFVVALIEPAESRIQMLSAGHSPLLLFTASDGRVQNFAAHGIPFGLMDGIPYGDPQIINMTSGDMLVLVTDGFTEWMSPKDEEYGDERVEAFLKKSKDLPPDQIIAGLYDEVRAFGNGVEQADDLTAVVIKKI